MSVEVDDCWNRVGVRGDGSCAELATRVHCRNCPVYSAAAARLLDRDLSPERLDEATDEVALAIEPVASDSASAIIFRIGLDWFALSPLAFDEITETRPIRPLPHRRGGSVLGLVNVRGELLVCLSLAKVLGLPDVGEPAAAARLVVVGHHEGRIAFPVDEVRGVHAYQPHELKALPTTLARTASNLADGMLGCPGLMAARLDGARLADALNRSVA